MKHISEVLPGVLKEMGVTLGGGFGGCGKDATPFLELGDDVRNGGGPNEIALVRSTQGCDSSNRPFFTGRQRDSRPLCFRLLRRGCVLTHSIPLW